MNQRTLNRMSGQKANNFCKSCSQIATFGQVELPLRLGTQCMQQWHSGRRWPTGNGVAAPVFRLRLFRWGPQDHPVRVPATPRCAVAFGGGGHQLFGFTSDGGCVNRTTNATTSCISSTRCPMNIFSPRPHAVAVGENKTACPVSRGISMARCSSD